MPAADFFVRQGDTGIMIDTLEDATGVAININAATVALTATPIRGGTPAVNAATAANLQNGDGSDGTLGHVSYTWTPTQTAADGLYLASWEVTYSDLTKQTFPNDGYVLVEITPDPPTTTGRLYVSVEELKATLEIGQSFADKDVALAAGAAARAIDAACGRRFYLDADATQVRYYTPRSFRRLELDDVSVLTSVALDRTGTGSFSETWVNGTDFVLEPHNAAADFWPYESLVCRRLSGRWLPAYIEKSVQVTGQFGWPAVPDNIREATSILAGKVLKRAREAPFGIVTAGIDQGTAMRIARTDPDVYSLLRTYTRNAPFA